MRICAEPKPSLRLANLLRSRTILSVDPYVEDIVAKAKLVVVRLLGGVRYWPYGIEQIAAECRKRGIPLAFLPGDDQPDPELQRPQHAAARRRASPLAVSRPRRTSRMAPHFLRYGAS